MTFKNSLIVQFSGYKGVSSPRPVVYSWSTAPDVNAMYGDHLRYPIVKSSSTDANHDGKADALKLSLSLPLQADEVITGVTTVAFVGVALHSSTRVTMDAVIVGSSAGAGSGGLPGSALHLDGDLVFTQRDSFPSPPAGVYAPYLNDPLPQPEGARSLADVRLDGLIDTYRKRNATVRLDVPYPVWVPDTHTPVTPGSDADTTAAGPVPRAFTLTLTARVPPTAVRVRPGVAEELKHGWIQYFSFLPVTALAAWVLRAVLFGYRILDTRVVVDVPKAKAHLE